MGDLWYGGVAVVSDAVDFVGSVVEVDDVVDG